MTGLSVLWAIKGLGPGGAERLLTVAAATRDRTGLPAINLSCVRVLDWKDHLVADLEGSGVTVHSLGVRRGLDPRWVLRLIKLLRRERFDIVHAHSPTVAIVCRLTVRSGLGGRPRPLLVTTEHNAWTNLHPLTRLGTRLTTGLDDASISVSEETRRSLKPERNRVRSRVVIHGIDLVGLQQAKTRRQATRAALGVGHDDIVITTVANYRAQKNYPNLLEAARRILADGRFADAGVTFLAVGQGPLEADITRLHHDLGLGDRFRLLGYRDDAVDVLAASDIFVLASDYEGLPVALMEALGLGLPVVATAVGGVAETLTPDAGTLVAVNDPAGLADALGVFIEDPARRSGAAAAAARLGAAFDARRSTAAVEAIYRSL